MSHCFCCAQVGPLPIGPDSTYVEQYPDGHIPWVKRPNDDLGDSGAMVCSSNPHTCTHLYIFTAYSATILHMSHFTLHPSARIQGLTVIVHITLQ